MFGKNPFSFEPLDKEEKEKIKQDQKEIDAQFKETVETAAACLSSDTFAKYKKKYIEAERGLIEIGIRLSIASPFAYAVAAHRIFSGLNMLKMLGDEVDKDSRDKNG